ncbi:MAG: excinuclease ABC subunit C, partial [Bradyrhizobium sp.]|nr:excinuclease ABC subunit C [Bradyrhizobium sp.]
MDHDSSDTPQVPVPPTERSGAGPASAAADLPPQDPALEPIDPAAAGAEDDDEGLPDVPDESGEALPEGRLASGHAAIEHAVRHAPTSPGVYRMLNAGNDVLYVGKA